MPDIKNNTMLVKMLSKVASEVIFQVSSDMLEVLANDIMEYTYGVLPNAYYYNGTGMPTFQFLEAFKLSDVQQKMNEIVTELYYDWQTMDYDPSTYLHGTTWSGDLRQELADILNVSGYTGFSNKDREPYWDIFIQDMFSGGLEKLFDKYTKQEFKKFGINVL